MVKEKGVVYEGPEADMGANNRLLSGNCAGAGKKGTTLVRVKPEETFYRLAERRSIARGTAGRCPVNHTG